MRPAWLFLDFFGTLVDYDEGTPPGTGSHAFLLDRGARLSHAEFVERLGAHFVAFEAPYREQLGEFSMVEVSTPFLAEALGREATEEEVEEFLGLFGEEWNRGVVYPWHIVETMAALRKSARIVVVTNTHDSALVPNHLRSMQIAGFVDEVVASVDLGRRKPDPAIYLAALAVAGARPDQVLFVGDTPDADYHGPVAMGMSAVLVGSRPDATIPAAHRLASIADLPAFIA